jgi:peptidoglycan/LPS O-acetylase OafA/YrhL/SAM-dependent methyltransferase
MRLTGERPIEGKTPASLLALHAAGYREVVARIGPGRLLDLGCGLGDGSAGFLAADRVVTGVDYDPATAALAALLHPGLETACTDASRLALRAGAFDFACSSHLIEHFHEPAHHVAEVSRVLGPDGAAYFITPNAPADFENPYHVHLFERDDLAELLGQHFQDVTVWGLDGDDLVKADFERRRRWARRLLALDVAGLRHRLPRNWYVRLHALARRLIYPVFALRDRLRPRPPKPMTADRFGLTERIDPSTLVLFAEARRPRPSGSGRQEPVVSEPAGAHDGRLAHVPGLDGLRGLAVAGVVAYHLGYLRGGFLGVDAFFVLSGFLITSLLLGERHRRGRIALGSFWGRRARRLLPALGVLLVAVGVYAYFFASATEGQHLGGDIAATAGYIANWHLIFGGVGYFEQFASPSLLQHAWSLAVEEQFYLVWPIVVAGILAWRRGRTGVLAVLAGVAAVGSVIEMAVLYQPGHDTSRLYYGTDTRAASVLIGALLAIALTRWPVRAEALGRVGRGLLGGAAVAAAAVTGVAWTVAGGSDGWLYRGGFAGLELALGLVILAVMAGVPGPLRRLVELAPLRWLGLISYGLYLWHWPVIVVLSPERTGWDGPLLAVTRIAVMVSLTLASYWLIETPVRRGRRGTAMPAIRWGPALAGAAAASLALAGLATARPEPASAALLKGGFVAPATSVPATAAPAPSAPAATPRPSNGARPAPAPTTSTTVPPRRALVVGDSTATTLASGRAGAAGSFVVGSDTQLGCGLTPGRPLASDSTAGAEHCDGWYERWRESIASVQPAVTIMMFGPWDVLDHLVDGTAVRFGSPQWHQLVASSVGQALDVAGSGGAPVAVLDVPCYASPPSGGPDAPVRDDPARSAALDAILEGAVAARPYAHVLDVSGVLCPGGKFLEKLDGITLRPDGVHLTPQSSALLWKTWLVPRLEQILG